MDQLGAEDPGVASRTAEQHVTSLYRAHALSLARLALVMLGDAAAAEDVVQDAFLGLYRRWDRLSDPVAAQSYLRTSVLNGCRTALRRRSSTASSPMTPATMAPPTTGPRSSRPRPRSPTARNTARCSPRSGGFPARQREALVLRYSST